MFCQSQVQVGLTAVLAHLSHHQINQFECADYARPYQYHPLSTQVNGQLTSAGDGRLFIQYSNGTIHNVWQNTGVFNGNYSVSGNFTTPTGVNSFQVGTEVVLDKGYLAFDDVTLTAYSAPINVAPLGWYRLTAEVTGELEAGLGQGGKIWAVYENAAGQNVGSNLLWQNPTNFNGTVTMQDDISPGPTTVRIRITLETDLDAGNLAFSSFALENYPFNGDIIQRSTYSVAGQPIANRQTGLMTKDNFDDGTADGWTPQSGSWSVTDYAYKQTSTTGTRRSSYPLPQSGSMTFEWRATFNSGNRIAGLHFFASNGTQTNHGNSYLVKQHGDVIGIYQTVNNSAPTEIIAANVQTNVGQNYLYKVTYNPATGQMTVWRDGVQVLTWTFNTPLTTGQYLALRTESSNVSFDNVRVTAQSGVISYLYSDHLGSMSAMSNPNGTLIPGSQARYLPFGGWRTEPTAGANRQRLHRPQIQ